MNTKKLLLVILSSLFVLSLLSLRTADKQKTKVVFIGDSTVRNGMGDGRNGQWGWADQIANYFDTTRIALFNNARGGRSSRSYISEGLWEEVFQTLNEGDFVLIQFGHNDGSAINDTLRARGSIKGIGEEYEDLQNLITKRYETARSYGWYLRKYIRETKARGATPIIVSPIPQNKIVDGKFVGSMQQYARWAEEVATAENVPFIDLNKLSTDALSNISEQYGKAVVDSTYYYRDWTHTSLTGAKLNASLVVKAIKALENCDLKTYLYDKTVNLAALTSEAIVYKMPLSEGNYDVAVTLGSKSKASETTVRAESRRLFADNVKTAKGKFRTETFTINIRNSHISPQKDVRLKVREKAKLNWDDCISFEFTGKNAAIESIRITPNDECLTVFLCGNSTVVDQDNEPWAAWGQMLPLFFGKGIAIANYAESGESASSFINEGRLEKLLTQAHAGDYMFIEFGHNDQKQTGEGVGAWTTFTASLKKYISEARKRGIKPVLLTPVQRRNFENGKIINSHLDYPDAIRKLAADENVPLIDLHKVTAILYEALGEKNSVNAFVHYPANTFPNQAQALADNTHFNSYGAYEIARIVIEGIKQNKFDDILKYLKSNVKPFDPSKPDALTSFKIPQSPFVEIEKPEGN
ncbi:MAG: rhamnogalacturonan acetylesterase [Paludibacter sp.]|jgi:lysophospholipase L1-like esterase|nr:rhamnogalacturonan acetylesterase [Paludibacter sp.]